MKKETMTILIAEFLFAAFLAVGIGGYMGPILGIGIALISFLIVFVLIRKEILPVSEINFFEKNLIPDYLNVLFASASISVLMIFFMGKQILNASVLNKSLLGISVFLFSFCPLLLLEQIRKRRAEKNRKEGESVYGKFFVVSGSFLIPALIFFFLIPGELFLNNTDEFSFSLMDVFGFVGVCFATVILAIFVVSFIPEKAKKIIISVVNSLTVCGYVQYMFFNHYVKELSGGAYRPEEHMVFTVVDATVWLVILGTCVIIPIIKPKMHKVIYYMSVGVFALLLCSFLFLLVKTPAGDLQREQYYLSGEEQFTVGGKENVIVFILDGVDNSFIKEILRDAPEAFEAYSDFTLYTDTCSVYDFSCPSILQFLYGYTYSEGTDRSLPFQERYIQAGYRFLPFNDYAVRNPENIDNYLPADASTLRVKYREIRNNMITLSGYQLFPCAFKGMMHAESVNFATCIEYKNTGAEIITDNRKFEENLHLEYNSYSEKCFIYQHIEGAHYPCDYVEETKYCLSIFAEYMRQLKELGVYDNTTIILASDHGIHDDTSDVPFPTAATPMFMVKRMQENHEEMIIDDTPMYYVDFQPTILSASGYFEPETDYKLFGKPIEDYEGTTVRERSWFDTGFGNQKTRKYTYKGDASELERVVKEGIFEETDSYKFIYREE